MNEPKDINAVPEDAWRLLSPRLTDVRREKMLDVAKNRTEHVRLVLQDIHDPHNIAACYRSAEAMGVCHVDVVNTFQAFKKPSTVARGSANWLEINRFESIKDYVSYIKKLGFVIAAGYPSQDNVTLDQIPIEKPIAVVFGNEHQGVHADWLEHIDIPFTIPMFGMVESYNISVSAALSMFSLTSRARKHLGSQFTVNDIKQNKLLSKWVMRHSRSAYGELEQLRKRNFQDGSGPRST